VQVGVHRKPVDTNLRSGDRIGNEIGKGNPDFARKRRRKIPSGFSEVKA
jgi:hypothetical protein